MIVSNAKNNYRLQAFLSHCLIFFTVVFLAPKMSFAACQNPQGIKDQYIYDNNIEDFKTCTDDGWKPYERQGYTRIKEDKTPDPIFFETYSTKPDETVIVSDWKILTGVNVRVRISIDDRSKAFIQVKGGSWVKDTTLNEQDRFRIRTDSQENQRVVIKLGDATLSWLIKDATAIANKPETKKRICNNSFGDKCEDGSVYIGSDKQKRRYITSKEHEMQLPWNKGEITFIKTGTSNPQDGEKNTKWLASVNNQASPYKAALYCANLDAHGHMDWYLPAIDELNLLWNDGDPIQDLEIEKSLDSDLFFYWSSTESTYYLSKIQRFLDGKIVNFYKHTDKTVRCMRQERI